jgi:hypothetical protein
MTCVRYGRAYVQSLMGKIVTNCDSLGLESLTDSLLSASRLPVSSDEKCFCPQGWGVCVVSAAAGKGE